MTSFAKGDIIYFIKLFGFDGFQKTALFGGSGSFFEIESCYVAQASLKLVMLLPQSPKFQDNWCVPPCP
jgi:hypothetical protein